MASKASLRVSTSTFQGCQLLCDFSTRAPSPLLPPPFRNTAFAAVHTLAHPGIRATKPLMSACWVWTGMSTDITRWSRDCQFCQRAKATRQPLASVQQMPIPARRFSHIHLDLVGPLPRSKEDFNHLLTVVDCSSRWLEAFLLESTSTKSIADTFVGGWVPALVLRITSPLTAALSSVQHSGLNSLSTWVLFTTSPLPTTLKPTAW